jgi:tripartite-type tricarboxylate transporter receptor subunit TctC
MALLPSSGAAHSTHQGKNRRTMMFKRFIVTASLVLIASTVQSQIHGQVHGSEYPSRAITIVVPFAAGGPNDILARFVVDHMTHSLGQPVLIENVGGGGGTIGSTRVAKADPDGHTLLVGNLGNLAAGFALYKNIKYDPRDFVSVGMIAETPNFLVVNNRFPAANLQGFIAYAKANPQKVKVGNAGFGANSHLTCLYLEHLAGVKLTHVAYRGTAPAMQDLLSGEIDGICDAAPNVVPHMAAGTIRGLVVAQPTRVAAVPNVPSATEAGLANFNVAGWTAIVAPPKTPRPIVARLNAALNAALADDGVRKKIEQVGAVPPPAAHMTPEWMDGFLRQEVEQWGRVVHAAGASIE